MVKEQYLIDFNCVNDDCKNLIAFPAFNIEKDYSIKCESCGKEYIFNQEFADKIKTFSNLILSVREAKDILGNTNVAIDIEEHSVKIPYRLLLTRLNTIITINIGDKNIDFTFRVEPLRD